MLLHAVQQHCKHTWETHSFGKKCSHSQVLAFRREKHWLTQYIPFGFYLTNLCLSPPHDLSSSPLFTSFCLNLFFFQLSHPLLTATPSPLLLLCQFLRHFVGTQQWHLSELNKQVNTYLITDSDRINAQSGWFCLHFHISVTHLILVTNWPASCDLSCLLACQLERWDWPLIQGLSVVFNLVLHLHSEIIQAAEKRRCFLAARTVMEAIGSNIIEKTLYTLQLNGLPLSFTTPRGPGKIWPDCGIAVVLESHTIWLVLDLEQLNSH